MSKAKLAAIIVLAASEIANATGRWERVRGYTLVEVETLESLNCDWQYEDKYDCSQWPSDLMRFGDRCMTGAGSNWHDGGKAVLFGKE